MTPATPSTPASSAAPAPAGLTTLARYPLLFEAEGRAFEAAVESVAQALVASPQAPEAARARGLLGHILMARHEWLARLGALERRPWVMFPDWSLAQIRDDAARLDRAFADYLAALPASALGARFRYQSVEGAAFESTRQDVLVHVINHGWYHRGQIARLVHLAGGPRARTDYVFLRVVGPDDQPRLPGAPDAPVAGLRALMLSMNRVEALATQRQIDALRLVTPEGANSPEYSRALGVLRHVQNARHTWLAALGGIEQRLDTGFDPAPLDAIEADAQGLDRLWQTYLEGLDDATARRDVTFRWRGHEHVTLDAHDVVTHVALHSTYHRGQVAMLISACGGPRPSTDWIVLTRTPAPAGVA